MTSVSFIYKGKEYSTPNLEKKLKRLKASIDDIEIIEKITPPKLTKELRHLKNCFEGVYSNGFTCYYDKKEDFPNKIGEYTLIKIKPFNEWAKEYEE